MPQYPYIEQHPPSGQLPQTVPPLEAPQVPSVVTGLVGEAPAVLVGGPMTGSLLLRPELAGGGAAEEAVVVVAVVEIASEQPFWQPLLVRQC